MKWNRAFVKGDYHGQFRGLKDFCDEKHTTTDDLLICLGDVGLNYNLNVYDEERKRFLSKMPITFLMLRGNHEARPESISTIRKCYDKRFKCEVYYEQDYPNIYYINCDVFNLNGLRCLAISGAYSVDKEYRLMMGYKWFADEQPTEEEKEYVRKIVKENPTFNYVFSHTCPISHEPTHLFLNNIDQSKVDKTTELFLEEIYQQVHMAEQGEWLCGHYHSDEWLGGKIHMLFHDYYLLLKKEKNKND